MDVVVQGMISWTRLTWAPPLDLSVSFQIGELELLWPDPPLESFLWVDMAPLGTWVHGTWYYQKWDHGVISSWKFSSWDGYRCCD